MMTKIDVSMPRKLAGPGTGKQPSSLFQAKSTSRLKLVLAWSVVLLPLAWGLYTTGQTAAPLVRTLLVHNH